MNAAGDSASKSTVARSKLRSTGWSANSSSTWLMRPQPGGRDE
jgi:hypothetical protein